MANDDAHHVTTCPPCVMQRARYPHHRSTRTSAGVTMADFVGSTDATRQQQEQLEEMADVGALFDLIPVSWR